MWIMILCPFQCTFRNAVKVTVIAYIKQLDPFFFNKLCKKIFQERQGFPAS